MRRRVLVILLVFVILVFALLQVKYAFQMKLITMVIQTKIEKTVNSIGNKVEDIFNSNSSTVNADSITNNESVNANSSNQAIKETDSSKKSQANGQTIGQTNSQINSQSKSIKETFEEVKSKKPKSDFTEDKNLTLSEKEIAKIFTPAFENMRKSYIGRMESLIDKARAEYYALPEEERENNKLSLGFKYMELGEELEKKCDAEFNDVVDMLKRQLTKSGCDMSLADTAKMEYEQQKYDLKKTLIDKMVN